MIGIPIALIYSNAVEWGIHKYILHGLGKKKNNRFQFHWHEHHKNSRKNNFIDPSYKRFPFGKHPQGKELKSLVFLSIAHLPVAPIAPFFTLTALYCAANYYTSHRKSHLDLEWAKEHLPWHVDHHMGKNMEANWCVTKPWFDHIMGTRIDYSKKEKHDRFTKLILKTKKVAQKGLEATKPIKIPFQTIQ